MKFKCPECQEVCEFSNEELGNVVSCSHCKVDFTLPDQAVSPGTIIGDYEVKKEIGRGRYGKVFYAHDLTLDRDIALKVLLKRYSRDSNFIAAFFKEARSVAQLNHPNIVQAYRVSEEDGQYYQAMEFIEGGSLRDWLDENETLPFTFAVPLVHQVVEALNFAVTESKIYHDDIKPENILINTRKQVKVSDLGLAKTEGMYDNVYSSYYTSPEEFLGSKTDSRSDIYSLGVVLYEVLVGHVPFKGDDPEEVKQKHIKQQLSFPLNKAASKKVPLALRSILLKMMAKHPDDRYQTMAGLSEDLKYFKKNHNCSNTAAKGFKGKGFTAVKSKVLRNKMAKKSSSFPVLPVIVALLLVIILILSLIVFSEGQTPDVDPDKSVEKRHKFLISEIANFKAEKFPTVEETREVRDLLLVLLEDKSVKGRENYQALLSQLDDELVAKKRMLAMVELEAQILEEQKKATVEKTSTVELQVPSFSEATMAFRQRFLKQYGQSIALSFLSTDLAQLKVRNSKSEFFQWKSEYVDLAARVEGLLKFLKSNETYQAEVFTVGSTTKKFSAYRDATILVQEIDVLTGEVESESRDAIHSLPLKVLAELVKFYESDELEREDILFSVLLWAKRFDEAKEFTDDLEGYADWQLEILSLKDLYRDNLEK